MSRKEFEDWYLNPKNHAGGCCGCIEDNFQSWEAGQACLRATKLISFEDYWLTKKETEPSLYKRIASESWSAALAAKANTK
jgi:hypothetical protein